MTLRPTTSLIAAMCAGALLVPTLAAAHAQPASSTTDRTAPAPAQEIALTDATGEASAKVTASRKVRTDGGRRYLGDIIVTIGDVPGDGFHGPNAQIFFDTDGDDAPEFAAVTDSASGHAYVNKVSDFGPQASDVDVTAWECITSEYVGDGLAMTYNPTCLGTGSSIRVVAELLVGEDKSVHPIGALRTWSEPVATPRDKWRYCSRTTGSLYGDGNDTLMSYTAVQQMSCRAGSKVLKKASRAFRRSDRTTIKLGKFRCSDPNGIGNSITCRHRAKPQKRWAYSWFLP